MWIFVRNYNILKENKVLTFFFGHISHKHHQKCYGFEAKREMMSNETGESVDLLFESRDQLIVISGILIQESPHSACRQWTVGQK